MRQLLIAAFCLVAAEPPEPAIDGKSLTGWDGLTANWKVADGAIIGMSDGSIKENTFLCTQKKFKDFEMTFQVRLKDGIGNSGVQIRSEVFEKPTWRVKGPQADICDKHYGCLYGENFGGMMQECDWDKIKSKIKLNDFNDYSIRVVGKKVTLKVNGMTTVDREFDNLPADGIIALQLHKGPAMEVAFRNIKLRELK